MNEAQAVDAARVPEDQEPRVFPRAQDERELESRREAVRKGWCPVCGRGPYRVVLMHASKKHGIERHLMRDLCGLTYRESVCDEDVSEAARARWMEREDLNPATRKTSGRPPSLSPEARRRAGVRIANWAAENPDEHRRVASENGKRNTAKRWGHLPPSRCKGCDKEVPRAWVRCEECRSARERRWARVLEMRRQGMTDREIAAVLGVTRRTATKVRHTAERNMRDAVRQGGDKA